MAVLIYFLRSRFSRAGNLRNGMSARTSTYFPTRFKIVVVSSSGRSRSSRRSSCPFPRRFSRHFACKLLCRSRENSMNTRGPPGAFMLDWIQPESRKRGPHWLIKCSLIVSVSLVLFLPSDFNKTLWSRENKKKIQMERFFSERNLTSKF